jgi:hypothetical protein
MSLKIAVEKLEDSRTHGKDLDLNSRNITKVESIMV